MNFKYNIQFNVLLIPEYEECYYYEDGFIRGNEDIIHKFYCVNEEHANKVFTMLNKIFQSTDFSIMGIKFVELKYLKQNNFALTFKSDSDYLDNVAIEEIIHRKFINEKFDMIVSNDVYYRIFALICNYSVV